MLQITVGRAAEKNLLTHWRTCTLSFLALMEQRMTSGVLLNGFPQSGVGIRSLCRLFEEYSMSSVPVVWMVGCILFAQCAASEPTQESIGFIEADLKFLAADELSGRGVGTEGIARAADFIEQRFRELKLRVDHFDGTAFQRFTIKGPTQIGPANNNFLAIENRSDRGRSTPFRIGHDFNPLALGTNGKFLGAVVFAGYGITAKELNYDDYAGIDVAGKVVIVLRKEPQQADEKSIFAGTKNTDYAPFTSKVLNAALHKAAALVIVNDSVTVASQLAETKKKLDAALANLDAHARQAPTADVPREQQTQWNERLKILNVEIENLRNRMTGNFDPVLGVNEAGTALSNKQVPTLFCSRAKLDPFIKAALGKGLDQLEREIDTDLKPRSIELSGWQMSGEVLLQSSETPVHNVIGVLPGEGNLKDEFVVVGAHYDHVGMGGMGSLAPGTIEVHNGADDNASGTTAMLAIARNIVARQLSPRRSLIFIAFTAEESGLLGSKHYVRNPRWPLERTVAMLNLDMVGRLSNNELSVYGTGTSPSFSELIDKFNIPYDFKIIKEPAGRGPSDHASFYEHKVPVLHFFTGLHNDYHRPSDDYDKVNLRELTRISNLVSDLAVELACNPIRPAFQSTSGSARPRKQKSPRAIIGVRLATEGNQVVVSNVNADSPAAQAGMQPGDVVVEVDSTPLTAATQLQNHIAGKMPGDIINLNILRNGMTIKVSVRLGM